MGGQGGCCGGGGSPGSQDSQGSESTDQGSSMQSGGCCGTKSASTESAVAAGVAVEFLATDEQPVEFTENAIVAVKNAISQDGEAGDGLRVSVVGGGCSGYQYDLNFEKEERMGDLVIDGGGVKIYIDSVSAGYLKGTVVDYISGLQGTGFKFNNPNAKRTCGCGSSFS